jgi:ribosome maturation factor RimP
MTDPRAIKSRLIAIAEPVCAGNGYELVDLEYESGNAGWVVRLYIDHAPASVGRLDGGISFDDCSRLSRELSAVLDVEDPLPHAYSLEVSSPGVDRPLRVAAHFAAQVGQLAKVQLAEGLEGRRNFKGRVLGLVEGGEGEAARVQLDVDGTTFALALEDIERARLVPDWDAVFKAGKANEKAEKKAAKQSSKNKKKRNERPEAQD